MQGKNPTFRRNNVGLENFRIFPLHGSSPANAQKRTIKLPTCSCIQKAINLIQTNKEYRNLAHNASFDTFKAKKGPLYTPQSVDKCF